MTPEERFWSKVTKADGCWEWLGGHYANGYARAYYVQRRPKLAHRVSYQLAVGSIPTGLDLDHLCRNRGCVNPAHLEPVTRRENLLRGNGIPAVNLRKTHCQQGHPYSGKNLKVVSTTGHRRCRICDHQADQRRRPRHRVTVAA